MAGLWGDDRRSEPCSPRRVIEFAGNGQVLERGRQVGTWRQNGPAVTVSESERGREMNLMLDGDVLTMPAQEGRPGGSLRRCPG